MLIPPPESFDVTSTNARYWAEAFIALATEHPDIATDRDTMATWFANAIEAGRGRDGRRQT